jgi:hypothetical protein
VLNMAQPGNSKDGLLVPFSYQSRMEAIPFPANKKSTPLLFLAPRHGSSYGTLHK